MFRIRLAALLYPCVGEVYASMCDTHSCLLSLKSGKTALIWAVVNPTHVEWERMEAVTGALLEADNCNVDIQENVCYTATSTFIIVLMLHLCDC